MLQKNTITEIPQDTPGFYSNIFLVHKASEGWRPVIDLKQLNAHIDAPHFHMHYKLSADYCRNRRLRFLNRLAGCVLSCTCNNTSRQQEVPMFCLKKHCPSGICGTHGSLPPSSGDIGNFISL